MLNRLLDLNVLDAKHLDDFLKEKHVKKRMIKKLMDLFPIQKVDNNITEEQAMLAIKQVLIEDLFFIQTSVNWWDYKLDAKKCQIIKEITGHMPTYKMEYDIDYLNEIDRDLNSMNVNHLYTQWKKHQDLNR